jgi:hypothetical protein
VSSPSLTSQVAVSLLFLRSLGLIAFHLIAFHLIGSSIDSDGMLHEPFALIPIGLWLIVAGALVGAVGLARAAVHALARRRR